MQVHALVEAMEAQLLACVLLPRRGAERILLCENHECQNLKLSDWLKP